MSDVDKEEQQMNGIKTNVHVAHSSMNETM